VRVPIQNSPFSSRAPAKAPIFFGYNPASLRCQGQRSGRRLAVRRRRAQGVVTSSKESCTMISRQEVEHVARLARLHFDEEELARLQPELGQIIDYVQQLSELDLSGLQATSHAVALKNVLRPDEPVAGLTQAEATSNGPDVERGQFVVPRIG
jgi:aspartyl-tRNA(Asn)/glutamyl-tRNA(Gln) amidotransferase subunit C